MDPLERLGLLLSETEKTDVLKWIHSRGLGYTTSETEQTDQLSLILSFGMTILRRYYPGGYIIHRISTDYTLCNQNSQL